MGQEPSQIRSEIAATRARMDDTVDALEYKADVPARLNDRVDTVKATIGDVATSVAERVGATLDGVQKSVKSAVSGALSPNSAAHSSSPNVREGRSDVQED